MLRNKLLVVLAASIVALAGANHAWAWGACHAGFIHIGPGSIYRAGLTHVRGPFGGWSGGHAFGVGACGDGFHGGYRYGYHYGGYGGYAAGGFRAGGS